MVITVKKKLLVTLAILALIVTDQARAGSLGDFFKALGNSIAHPGQKKAKPRETPSPA